MLNGLLNGLITAWVLTLFDIDNVCIRVLQPFVKERTLTRDHFYFTFGWLGLVGGLLADIFKH